MLAIEKKKKGAVERMKNTGKDAVAGQGTTQNNGMAEDWKNEEVDCGGENQSGLGEKQLKERTGPDVSLQTDADKGCQVTLPQHGGPPNGSPDVPPPVVADSDRQGPLPQHQGQSKVLRDVPPPMDEDNGRQGLLPQHGDHKVLNLIEINKYFVPDDVYPHMAPTGNDGCVRGSLYAQADIPGPEEERGRTSGSLPNEADVPRPEEERGRNDDPLRVAEMGSPCHSSGCQKTRNKGLEEMMGGEGEKRK